jgi:hypothetical protein
MSNSPLYSPDRRWALTHESRRRFLDRRSCRERRIVDGRNKVSTAKTNRQRPKRIVNGQNESSTVKASEVIFDVGVALGGWVGLVIPCHHVTHVTLEFGRHPCPHLSSCAVVCWFHFPSVHPFAWSLALGCADTLTN